MDLPLTKPCEWCGAEIRWVRQHYTEWARKRFCDGGCAARSRRRERPLCACGCGERVRALRSTYRAGHQPRVERSYTWEGYVRLRRPGHPLAGKDGYVLEHRYVVHEAGIHVPADYHVHHKNGIKDDNRLENLQVLSNSEHGRCRSAA